MKKFLLSLLKPSKKIFYWLIVPVILVFAVVVHLGYLDNTILILDSKELTFEVGKVKFSLYAAIKAIFTSVIIFWIANFLLGVFEKFVRNITSLHSSNKELLVKILQILIYCTAFLIILNILGIDLTTFAVLGGAIGIGVGFGLQKITSNFISGIILLFEKAIEHDDLVQLADGTYGYVREMRGRYTVIETFDSKEVLVPNEDLITGRVTNWTFNNPQGRIEITVGISYKSDPKKALELILEAATEHPNASKSPPPECYMTDFADSSINFLLYLWVDDVRKGRLKTKSDVLFSIYDKFHQNNIEIPFPQRDVYIKQDQHLPL